MESLDRLRAAASGCFEGTPVVFAYLFGSVAEGRAGPASDVDVAVYLEPDAPSERYLDLSLELAGTLSEASRVGGIEVLVLNDAPLPIKGRVVRQRIVLFSRDEPARVAFESRTLREFFDFQIHAVPLDGLMLREIAEGHRRAGARSEGDGSVPEPAGPRVPAGRRPQGAGDPRVPPG